MCNFFSLVSDGKGKIFYFNWTQRQQILKGKLKDSAGNKYEADSHSSILKFEQEKRNYIGIDFENKFNKYEYNPLTKLFKIDQLNVKNDTKQVELICKNLDFSKIVKPLIIKKIINPIKIKGKRKILKVEKDLLKEWASVWDSVRAYISSFFNIKKYQYVEKENPYDCLIKLWIKGLVPSFDGKTWRLHGYKGTIVWEDKKHDIGG